MNIKIYYRKFDLVSYCGLTMNMYMYLNVHVCLSNSCLMVNYLCSYDDAVYTEWSNGVDEVAQASLEKSLLLRDPVVMHLTVNFDPKVVVVGHYKMNIRQSVDSM